MPILKKLSKKIFQIHKSGFLLILLSCFLLTSIDSNAAMFNKFKKGFYFEKYKTAEEAQNALLELHPIGSDVGELVKTLERAGGKCGIIAKDLVREKTAQNTYLVSAKILDKISNPKDYHQCKYIEYTLPFGFGEYYWLVTVYVEDTNYQIIKEMIVSSRLSII